MERLPLSAVDFVAQSENLLQFVAQDNFLRRFRQLQQELLIDRLFHDCPLFLILRSASHLHMSKGHA
eukprot:1796483-Pleurochrysis_carterae.AAC.3